MCSYEIFNNMLKLLTIVKTIPSIIIPIIRVTIVLYLCLLIWWPFRPGSALICSMSILLTVIVTSFKSLCAYGLGSSFMCLMSLFVVFVAMTHELLLRILIFSLAPTNISSMTYLTIIMTSRFGFLIFVTSFFTNFEWFSLFSTSVTQSKSVTIGSSPISSIVQSTYWIY